MVPVQKFKLTACKTFKIIGVSFIFCSKSIGTTNNLYSFKINEILIIMCATGRGSKEVSYRRVANGGSFKVDKFLLIVK